MLPSLRRALVLLAALIIGVTPATAAAGTLLPDDSRLLNPGPGEQVVLLAPLTGAEHVHTGAWRMGRASARPTREPSPRLGATALHCAGIAEAGGAKGDFRVASAVPGALRAIGLWVHLPERANVQRIGLQFRDAEGESFLVTRQADFRGWRWLEFDLTGEDVPEAWDGSAPSGLVAFPLRSISVVWFAREAGPSELTVNAMLGLSDQSGRRQASLAGTTELEPGRPLALPLVIVGDQGPQDATIEYQLQHDPRLTALHPLHPDHGSDRALDRPSWTELEGEVIERGSLTDPTPGTAASLPWGGEHTEAFQYVDLESTRQITHLAYTAADANWIWKLDIAASDDGQSWHDVPGLQDLDLHQRWGEQELAVTEPFDARYLRLRYHSADPVDTIRMPQRLRVYDGLDNEDWALPAIGEVLASGRHNVTIPAQSLAAVELTGDGPMQPGSYLLAARVEAQTGTELVLERLFVLPEPVTAEQQRRARIALNSSDHTLAPLHRRLGIGWVRFENLKWRMASPERDRFDFTGIPPWNVDHDTWLGTMAAENIQVLPYLFMCPEWASSAPEDASRRYMHPPQDYEDYAEFVFQTVARYGHVEHDPDVLKTEDKRTGLGLLDVYELWNEPNLNDPNWGHWIGTLEEYF